MIDSVRRRFLLSSTLISGLIVLQAGGAAQAGEIGDVVKTLAGGSIVHQRITLRDLGLTQPVTLGSSDARRDIYLPVPANVRLVDPSLVVDGHYIRADGGRTTYTMALDGNVVAARSPADAEGSADVSIGVDGAPRPSGFVRLGLAWTSAQTTDRLHCDDDRAIGNLLQISPDSYFEYGYDPSRVTDIASVWSALPRKVTLLVAGDALESSSYDAAWRLGVALERAGKDVQVVALPKVGSEIDTSGLKIPPALMNVPAFAALARGGKAVLSNEAEIGALLLLGAPQVRADVAVSDPALAAGLKTAFDAVGAQLGQADPAATAALEALASRKDTLLTPAAPKTVDVRTLAGRPVIAVSPDAAAAAASLFDGLWRKSAISSGMVLNTVGKPAAGSDSVALGSLDQSAGHLDVVARGDWTTTFDLGSLGAGKVPSSMDIDVSAAPGATETSPVASVFINDYLLGARRLTADGKPERISVDVPAYALLPRNTVRVQFQRQPASNNCEVPQGFPAAVLPNSRIWLKNAPATQDFSGMVARLAGQSEVIVPEGWRNSASETLPTLIRVADAAGISPSGAMLSLGETNASVTPKKPFLALDVPVAGAADMVKVSGQHVSIADRQGKTFYDVSGLDHVAVLQAVTGAAEPGISYRTVGEGPRLDKPFQLGQGDVAVVGEAGVLASVNSSGTPTYLNGNSGSGNEPFTLSKLLTGAFWDRHLSWVATAGAALAFLLLLLLAGRARKRRGGDQG